MTAASPVLFLWAIFAIGILLTGCASVEERQASALRWWAGITGTASGVVQTGKELVEEGKVIVEDTQAIINDYNRRMQQVQEGMEKMAEGKALIGAGLRGTEGTE